MLQAILDALHEVVESDQENDQVTGMLAVFAGKPLSASELMRKLGLSHRPSFRKQYLHPALDTGLIAMTIPDKPNSRLQKYRITP